MLLIHYFVKNGHPATLAEDWTAYIEAEYVYPPIFMNKEDIEELSNIMADIGQRTGRPPRLT